MLYAVLSAVGGIALLLVLKRRIAAAPRRRALAPLRDLKATLIGRKGEAGVGAALARLRLLALHDVVLADDRGVTQIDHLVRAGDGIVVIETKTYAGVITAVSTIASGCSVLTMVSAISCRTRAGRTTGTSR